jgi:hypothetical protein
MAIKPAKLLRLFLRIIVVLLELHMSSPENLVSAVVMLLTVLCIDQLLSAKFEQVDGDFDAHTIAFAALMSRPLGLARSLWAPAPEGSGFAALAMGAVWSVAGGMMTSIGKEARERREGNWLPAIINAQCGLGVMLTYAPFEPMWMYAARVAAFTCLSVLLYLGPPFGRNCYLEERGYLVCFCPVLFVDWWMACCFAFSSVVYIHRNDLMWLVGRGPARDPQATSEPGDSLI